MWPYFCDDEPGEPIGRQTVWYSMHNDYPYYRRHAVPHVPPQLYSVWLADRIASLRRENEARPEPGSFVEYTPAPPRPSAWRRMFAGLR